MPTPSTSPPTRAAPGGCSTKIRRHEHQPGFVCANFHASLDGERVINYAQWETEEHYRAMLDNPEVRVHMDQAAKIATDVQPRLFSVKSVHPR